MQAVHCGHNLLFCTRIDITSEVPCTATASFIISIYLESAEDGGGLNADNRICSPIGLLADSNYN